MQDEWTPFRGGETEALKRLEESLSNKVRLLPEILSGSKLLSPRDPLFPSFYLC